MNRADHRQAAAALGAGVLFLLLGIYGIGEQRNWFLIVLGAIGVLYGVVVLAILAVRSE